MVSLDSHFNMDEEEKYCEGACSAKVTAGVIVHFGILWYILRTTAGSGKWIGFGDNEDLNEGRLFLHIWTADSLIL